MRLAAMAYELYRLVRRPHTHGALVAIWWRGQLLLVQTSYRQGYSLPGGGLQPGESAHQAAIRELQEELGLTVDGCLLKAPWTVTEQGRGGSNTVTIYSLQSVRNGGDEAAAHAPELAIDHLEIVKAVWMRREQALQQRLPSHLRRYLEELGD